MLSQLLTYNNFYYNYTLFKLYNILLRRAKAKITNDQIFDKGGRASAGPRRNFAHVSNHFKTIKSNYIKIISDHFNVISDHFVLIIIR